MVELELDRWLALARATRPRHPSTAAQVAIANAASRSLPIRFRTGDRLGDCADAMAATLDEGVAIAWIPRDADAIMIVRCAHPSHPAGCPTAVTDCALAVTSGRIEVVAFGPPTTVRRVHDAGVGRTPMYIFDGPASAMMAGFFAHLAKARDGGVYATAYLHDAMVDLIGLQVALARDGVADPDGLARFRADAGAAMVEAMTLVRGYLYLAADEAEEAGEPDWYQFCIRRTAIELVRTEFPTVASRVFDPDDLERLDRELRRLAPSQEPLPEYMIPQGLSDAHWWWRELPAKADDPFALHL